MSSSRAFQTDQSSAPSSAYPQGLTVLDSPIALRQSPSVPESGQNHLSTQETPPMVVLNKRDFSLALSIRAAQADGRECPWYGVWAKVLQNYIFHDADGFQTACTCIPQYSLVASYDSGNSPETNTSDSPLESPRSLSDINVDSPPLNISAGSLSSYLPKPHFTPNSSTSNLSPRSLEVFGGPLPTLTPSPQPSPQIPRILPALESPTTHHVNYLRARIQHASTNIIHARVDAHPLPQSLTTQSLSNVILPSTPSRPRTGLSIGRNCKSARVPDFVQVLERTQQLYPATPDSVVHRVIMIIEIKAEPTDRYKSIDWSRLWKDQVGEQAAHAFDADPTLQYLGVIMAYGRRWVYCITRRPPSHTRTMSEKRDPTFRSFVSSETWESPEDSEDSNATPEDFKVDNPSLPLLEYPPFAFEAKGGETIVYDLYLLDPKQRSLRLFSKILEDMRNHNNDMWV